MKRHLLLIACLLATACPLLAQTVTDAGYRTIAHIQSDGTIQDESYRTIGHAKGIPPRWAALYFFFRK